MMSSPKIKSARAIKENILQITFSNGVTKLFDVSKVLHRPHYSNLEDFSFLKNVHVDDGGFSVYWNDDIDICEHELWLGGCEIQ